MEIQALRYHEHGAPGDVLKLETIDCAQPGQGEALVALRAAVLHPSDLGIIGGSYGKLRELPGVAGREGVGEVLAVGEGVARLSMGDLVRMPEESVLVDAVCADADAFEKAPRDLAPELAAMAFINPPTAYRLLKDFVDLKAGDWVIQNAANSAVGQCVIGLARHLGVHTINLVRDVAKWEAPLKEMGADVVLADGDEFYKQIEDATGGEKPVLGLNSIGGESVIKMIRSVADEGVVVTFGGMVGDKVRFPTRNLIFNDVCLRGFWMDKWSRKASADQRGAMQHEVNELMRQGVFQMSIAGKYSLADGVAAFEAAQAGGRDGKVIITGDFTL
ncbi:MDR family NADPH-dependent oxidoreductase [Cerasicoccus fimbriatus]|uniref:MDR family NADPH-dependent oxidoreductase n=1 Tax=Cerasicoccus fimbriatus TaxID=3014554 RepID=UPI0022B3739D|nr:2-enoyl thioester reductase domain-containing protein [Cerasicoccus sp. TK19100]